MKNPKVIAGKLRRLRELSGMTQGEVSERSGWSTPMISHWESGNRIKTIRVSQLEEVLSVYGITLTQFFAPWPNGEPPSSREYKEIVESANSAG